MIKLHPSAPDYKELDRTLIEGVRHYTTDDGPLPSVTTVLSATKNPVDAAALERWREQVGPTEAANVSKIASDRGNLMHNILEHWAKGIDFNPGNNLIHTQAKKMANVIRENIEEPITEIWGSEVPLYYPGLYAGTADLVIKWNGNLAIGDFKQTNKPKKEEWIQDYYLQLAAYAMAHNEMYGTDIREGHIFMCSVDRQYQQFSLTEDKFDYWTHKWAERLEQYYHLRDLKK